MRVVVWLACIFVASLLLGLCCWLAAGLVTGGNRTMEGLLSLAILIIMIAAGSSGILLLIIGPAAFYERFRQIRRPEDPNLGQNPRN